MPTVMTPDAGISQEASREAGPIRHDVRIPIGSVALEGDLAFPFDPAGLVVFAHGSGSSRHSVRNQHVARLLRDARMGTLLFDLLTPEEETVDRQTQHLRFDIGLLSHRLSGTAEWCLEHDETRGLPLGFFGASTGGAAALVAAAEPSSAVRSVVLRGGRPDLAGEALRNDRAPTLLIVGGEDDWVLQQNIEAYEQLTCERELKIIPGATHLFEEPGALEQVARHAAAWFGRTLAKGATR
jgi:putative phosphoribosyl transferase